MLRKVYVKFAENSLALDAVHMFEALSLSEKLSFFPALSTVILCFMFRWESALSGENESFESAFHARWSIEQFSARKFARSFEHEEEYINKCSLMAFFYVLMSSMVLCSNIES